MSIVSGPDRTNDRILEALDAACHDRLLESVGFDGYRFTHNVIRDVIWHDLGSATRAALHQQVGEALERESRETAPEVLAYHFGRGGDHAKEILYLERAGDKARTLFANGAAEAFYRELMERLDQFSRPADAARAREKLADILRITARYDEALEVLDRAAQLYRRAGAPSLGYWHVMAQWGRVHARRGTPESGIERIQALLNASHAEEPSAGLAALEITLAELYYVSGHYSEQLTAAERGAAFARALHDDRLITQANQWRSTAMLFLGQSDEAIPILKEVMFQSEEIGDLSYHLYALNHVALAYIQRGEFSNSDRYIQRGLETATLRGDAVQMALMTYYRGVLNVYIGDWKVARGAFEHAVALVRQVATAWTSAYPLLGLGHLCLLEGQWDAAGRFLQEAITVADRSGNLQALRNALAPLIERDLLEGRPKVARGRLDRLLDRQNAQEDEGVAQALALLAWTQLEQDELDRAAESASRGEARARADHNQIALVEVLRVRAMLAMRHRHWDEGTALLAEALTHSRNMPNPYQEARVLYLAGVLAFQSAHPEVARPHLEQAVQILTRLGERLYLDHVEQALARLSS
jgi:tetratricopeptide (TPR) repeat protein